ncbi:Bcl-2-likeous antagonist/killer [Holothuria leucospilota]|uniref:Bcl-2-likeous antagonist/killer n=1 Tax=Holothuria leucospilota TaxID=206669 RepID=A0A9Q1BRM5_HOLLE|nr:Bcl-2-likeous antagonist/killer [Holothuria leucospilota]
MAQRSSSVQTTTVSPDLEENVIEQTDGIVRNFFYQRFQMDMQSTESELCVSTPSVPEFNHFQSNPLSPSTQIGRRLAEIGDQINDQYAGEFRSMIQQLHITPSTAYSAFAGVARRLFTQGINWGRIAALLMFGYRIGMEVQRSFGQFINKIIQNLVKFIISEKITTWIASQGGWYSALTFKFDNNNVRAIAVIAALASLTVFAVWMSHR